MLKKNSSSNGTYYQEIYRPHLHFTPETMWMNDPNGLVYYKGEYHLFYQYHPNSKKWGPMHWGHAVSRDLLSWEHLPIALFPDENGLIFSGSCVVDWNNTSGFFEEEGLVAMFTHADGDIQSQSIAYSKDRGRTWKKYDGNPVIKNPGITDFRDPKVLWHEETEQWIMVLTIGRKVRFYSSSNLIEWNIISEFGAGWGAQVGIWECPDLFPLTNEETGETKWILQVGIDKGAHAGGSGTQYFVGHFDGTTFTPAHEKEDVRWLDFGKDFYAAQSFSDVPDNRQIIIAWMSNWEYANDVPTDPWRSAMSLPRELSLRKENGKDIIVQSPVKEIKNLYAASHSIDDLYLKDTELFKMRQPQAPFALEMEVDIEAGKMEFHFFTAQEGSSFVFGIDKERQKTYIKRTHHETVTFAASYEGLFESDLPKTLPINLQVVCDRSSVEIFLNNGQQVWTNLFLPVLSPDFEIMLQAINGSGTAKQVRLQELKSVWDKTTATKS
ncbi:glycoside hydrolase family 32 protein [Alteribacillus bidgolensis]|uniref:Fructan beta-fructosidase n=1 Tax=Alteribacillus bidgolensis TaxID=930129 RepID=A0A1G8MI87_9BACI|nr:glycoside hydrolase family 32 protein [Alteribacillus bidgolensis]SDI67545.1 fructan beta-fructosidase [Alteribacillus bidgolensis]